MAECYVDDEVSAYSGRVRPAYRRMLDDLRGGEPDMVVVGSVGWAVRGIARPPAREDRWGKLLLRHLLAVGRGGSA